MRAQLPTLSTTSSGSLFLDSLDSDLSQLEPGPMYAINTDLMQTLGIQAGSFEGQTALVAGSARGIGEATAINLAHLGARAQVLFEAGEEPQTPGGIVGIQPLAQRSFALPHLGEVRGAGSAILVSAFRHGGDVGLVTCRHGGLQDRCPLLTERPDP